MSDLSVTIHNLADLFAGRSDFAHFRDGEAQLIRENIASLPAVLRPATTLMLESLKAAASVAVAAGQTAIGPMLNDTADHQATMVLNLLQAAGVPTGGVLLSVAEHAALVQLINGLKAGLDKIGLQITVAGVSQKPAPVAPAIAKAA